MITFKRHPLATLRRSVVPPRRAAAPGFTLVELLVALGLVSLLMLMFAQVFQVATGTMSTQRGVMENDQRARSLTTIISNDLKNRSMRHLLPYQPNENNPATDYSLLLYPSFHGERFTLPSNDPDTGLPANGSAGFFSISENDATNQNDDVLHITVIVTAPTADPYYGKATTLPIVSPAPTPDQRLILNPNQPDADDAEVAPNSSASSSMAEIVYFLRNGNLYRRVLLIREPLDSTTTNAQPRDGSSGAGNDFFDPLLATPYYPFGSDFWNDFDFSGRISSATAGVRFSGDGSAGTYFNPLSNTTGSGSYAIAVPLYRFGHNPDTTSANGTGTGASVGNPREFLDSGMFIGRFTHEETSHARFNFPHSLSSDADDHNTTTGIPGTLLSDGNPMKMSATTNPLTDTDGDGVVDQFAQGPRRGEDILLSNVHDFDVKVWDELIGDYVDIGHTRSNSGGVNGDFHQNRNRRQSYGPQSSGNRMFDTWHPQFNANNDGAVDANDVPPFLPKINYGATWAAGVTYNVGDVVIPTTTTAPNLESLAFVATVGGMSAGAEPATWPNRVGDSVVDGGVTWQAFYNLKRVKSLKITIRYLDVTSDQMRQVTLIQSLLE